MRTIFRASICAGVILAIAVATSCGGPAQPSGPAPTINVVTPSAALFGDTVTVTGSGFLSTGNALSIGGGYISQTTSSDGATLRFTLSNTIGVCPPTAQVCPTIALVLSAGTFQVAVVNANGSSNTVTLQVSSR